ncbi:MAG: YraN family protein [Anaerolineae bacterium]
MPVGSTHTAGMHYEEVAASFLTGLGFTIVARNWRCPIGELDLVVRDQDTLVFVEVRARTSWAGYLPEETIGRRKMARLVATAEAYLARHPWEGLCRFDVVAITIRNSGTQVSLLKDAFSL